MCSALGLQHYSHVSAQVTMFIKKSASASPQSRKWETIERWWSFCFSVSRHGMNFTNVYYIPCPNTLVKITWHEPKEIPSHSATSLIVFDLLSPNHAIIYQFNTSAWWNISECSLFSMDVCPLLMRQNQSKTCGQLMAPTWKAVLVIWYILVPTFSSFMQKFTYRHCSVLLGVTHTTHNTNTALYWWWLYQYEGLQWGHADWGHAGKNPDTPCHDVM